MQRNQTGSSEGLWQRKGNKQKKQGPVEMDNVERKGSEPGQREAAPQGENMQDDPTIETLKEKHPHVNIVPKLCFKFVFTLIQNNTRGHKLKPTKYSVLCADLSPIRTS